VVSSCASSCFPQPFEPRRRRLDLPAVAVSVSSAVSSSGIAPADYRAPVTTDYRAPPWPCSRPRRHVPGSTSPPCSGHGRCSRPRAAVTGTRCSSYRGCSLAIPQPLARTSPGSVRGLITLGTPVWRRSGWTQNMSRAADRVSHLPRTAALLPRPWAEPGSLRVPATSVYTRADGGSWPGRPACMASGRPPPLLPRRPVDRGCRPRPRKDAARVHAGTGGVTGGSREFRYSPRQSARQTIGIVTRARDFYAPRDLGARGGHP
jgi:hypothetical protein